MWNALYFHHIKANDVNTDKDYLYGNSNLVAQEFVNGNKLGLAAKIQVRLVSEIM